MKKERSIVVWIIIVCAFLTFLVFAGCNGQYMAKNWGTTYEINLEPGYRLVEITWKDEDNLWYLIRPFEEGEEPTEYLFKEESAYDIIEGTVKIIEHKKEVK